MPARRVYLAKYRTSRSQRAHFAIFIPNATSDRASLAQDHSKVETSGTVIHVVGEPYVGGYTHEFKRNYRATGSKGLSELIFLGTVDVTNIHESSSTGLIKESTPRGRLEREATAVAAPPRSHDAKAPVDGVST
jgi:hypothetical protein